MILGRVCRNVWRDDGERRHFAEIAFEVFRSTRPCGRTADKRDELAPPHSITSSARAINAGEMVRPSALAVLRLITKSNFVGSSTGRSPGFSPLSMRAT